MGSRADSGLGCCEPGSGPGDRAAFPCACANASPVLPPLPVGWASCARPTWGSAQARFFPFFPCLWQRGRACWLRGRLVVGRGGGVGELSFLPGLTSGSWIK